MFSIHALRVAPDLTTLLVAPELYSAANATQTGDGCVMPRTNAGPGLACRLNIAIALSPPVRWRNLATGHRWRCAHAARARRYVAQWHEPQPLSEHWYP